MADASALTYRLKKLISKKKVSVGRHFELPRVVDDYRVVESDGKNCRYLGSICISTGAILCDALAGGQVVTRVFSNTRTVDCFWWIWGKHGSTLAPTKKAATSWEVAAFLVGARCCKRGNLR